MILAWLEKVFDHLMQPLGTGHHIFADRYYTTHKLLQFLSSRKQYYTGTLNLNRKNFPLQIRGLTLDHRESKPDKDIVEVPRVGRPRDNPLAKLTGNTHLIKYVTKDMQCVACSKKKIKRRTNSCIVLGARVNLIYTQRSVSTHITPWSNV